MNVIVTDAHNFIEMSTNEVFKSNINLTELFKKIMFKHINCNSIQKGLPLVFSKIFLGFPNFLIGF